MRGRRASVVRPAPVEGSARRPYSRPAILSRERLEALAVDCSVGGKDIVIICATLLQS